MKNQMADKLKVILKREWLKKSQVGQLGKEDLDDPSEGLKCPGRTAPCGCAGDGGWSVHVAICFTIMPLSPVMVLQIDAQQSWKEKELVSSLPPTIHRLCDLWCFTIRSLDC